MKMKVIKQLKKKMMSLLFSEKPKKTKDLFIFYLSEPSLAKYLSKHCSTFWSNKLKKFKNLAKLGIKKNNNIPNIVNVENI